MTPEQKQHQREYHKEYHIQNRDVINERSRRHHFEYRYGITKEEALALIVAADNKCQICKGIFTKENPAHIDHDHKTKRVRGVLCRTCNNGIGFFKDDIELLKVAISYLADGEMPPSRARGTHGSRK